jgi:hypothetical protein
MSEKQQPAITYAPMEEIVIYDVSEEELRILETGGAASVLLDLTIALLAFGGSTWITSSLSQPKSDRISQVLTSLIVVTLVAGLICFTLWCKIPSERGRVLKKIRARKTAPAEGTPASE